MQTLIAEGHDIQLHLHPQWQYSTYHDGEWTMDDGTHYALSDLAPEEASQLFESGAELLAQITGRKPMAFRAGGYTLQTWDYVKLFRDNGIKIDSSVRPGGYATGESHSGNNSRQQYDYRTIGFFHRYRFQHDVSICAINGEYVELPVSLAVIPKWKFLWQRYRYNDPAMIRIWADANQGATGMARGSKLKNFMKGFLSNASLDSKSARHLEQVYQIVSKKSNDFVVCSHPKGIAGYSIKFLEAFLSKHRKERFLTISDLITQNKQ